MEYFTVWYSYFYLPYISTRCQSYTVTLSTVCYHPVDGAQLSVH